MDLKSFDVLLDWALPDELLDEDQAEQLQNKKKREFKKNRRRRLRRNGVEVVEIEPTPEEVAEGLAKKMYGQFLSHSRDFTRALAILDDMHTRNQRSARALLHHMFAKGASSQSERRSLEARYWRRLGALDVLESLLGLFTRWELTDKLEGARFGNSGPSTTLEESKSGGSADHGAGTGSGVA